MENILVARSKPRLNFGPSTQHSLIKHHWSWR